MPRTLDNQDSCSPAPGPHWTTLSVVPFRCIGRDEGTDKFLGRSDSTEPSLHSSPQRRANLHTCVVQRRWCTPYGNEDSTRGLGLTALVGNPSGKTARNPLLGVVCPLTQGDLPRNCSQCGRGGHLRNLGKFLAVARPRSGINTLIRVRDQVGHRNASRELEAHTDRPMNARKSTTSKIRPMYFSRSWNCPADLPRRSCSTAFTNFRSLL
jgi:hypothetical protein